MRQSISRHKNRTLKFSALQIGATGLPQPIVAESIASTQRRQKSLPATAEIVTRNLLPRNELNAQRGPSTVNACKGPSTVNQK